MTKNTSELSNKARRPNAAKYRSVAKDPQTWAKMVNRTKFDGPNGCWEWIGTVNGEGYGVLVHHEMGNVLAHRLALHIVGRPVPEELTVDHLCRNPSCVNPDHLEPAFGTSNTMRGNGYYAKNARKTHCNHGHEYSADNTIMRHVRRSSGFEGWTRVCRTCEARWRSKKIA